MSENIDNERGQTFTAQKTMTTSTPTPTPEQIAEGLELAETEATAFRADWWNILNQPGKIARTALALAEQLAETRGQLRYQRILTEQIQTSHDLAATAVAEALEAARRLETMAVLAEGNVSGGVLPRDAVIAVVNQCLKQPPAPVIPSATKEVMPDTPGSRSNSGDTATPQASMLAPGADALIDRNALIDLLAKIEDGPYLGAEGVADAVIELLLPNLIRAHGGKP